MTTRLVITLCLALLCQGLFPNPFHPPRISSAPVDPHPKFSPTTTVQASDSIELKSNGYSGPVCVVFTELSRWPSPGSPLQNVNYGLSSTDGFLQFSVDGTSANPQEVLTATFPAGSKNNDRLVAGFLIEVFPSTLPPPGQYQINLKADIYASAYPPSGGIVDSAIFTITVQVGNWFDVSIVASNNAFSLASTTATLDFGTLAANLSRGADILVRSNLSYKLFLSSTNGGALASLIDGTKIPYSLKVNGSTLSLLPATQSLVANATASFGNPARYAVTVTILPYQQLPTEGQYSDLLTVIVSAP